MKRAFIRAYGLMLLLLMPCLAKADWHSESFTLQPNSTWPQTKANSETQPFRQPWPQSLNIGESGFFLVAIGGGGGLCDTLEVDASGECFFIIGGGTKQVRL